MNKTVRVLSPTYPMRLMLGITLFSVLLATTSSVSAADKQKLIAESDTHRYYLNWDSIYGTWARHQPGGTLSMITIKGYGREAGKEHFLFIKVMCKDQTLDRNDGKGFFLPNKRSINEALVQGVCNE